MNGYEGKVIGFYFLYVHISFFLFSLFIYFSGVQMDNAGGHLLPIL